MSKWKKAGTINELNGIWVKRVSAAANTAPKEASVSKQSNSAPNPNTKYYIMKNQVRRGPFSVGELRTMAASGAINRQTYVWKKGMSKWVISGSLKELADIWIFGKGENNYE
jgi:hypothetical protein